MSKDSLQTTHNAVRVVRFSDFWHMIACELGSSRLKVDIKAESIKYFLDAESDHRDFLRKIIHQSYKRCQCYHLKAYFDVNIALDVLGETSFKLQGTKEDDLLDIELLEEIAWLVSQCYGHIIKMPDSLLSEHYQAIERSSITTKNQGADNRPIFSLSKLRIKKANQRL